MDDKIEQSTSIVAFNLEASSGDDTVFESHNSTTIDSKTNNNDMNIINQTNTTINNTTIIVSNSRFNITKLNLNGIDHNHIKDDNNNNNNNNYRNSEKSEFESDVCEKNDEIQQPAMTPDEALPDMDNYRNMQSLNGGIKSRPTLLELQNLKQTSLLNLKESNYNASNLTISNNNNVNNVKVNIKDCNNDTNDTNKTKEKYDVVKFGWIKGVLIRCILNIFGVMIFLRLSWIVGQAGIGQTTIIILLATLVTLITALSTSAICTNGEVKGGGAYYLISRSLGPEFGGAIGIVFSFANAVAGAMYCIGFAETLVTLLDQNGFSIIDASINDVRIIGLITNTILLIIALVGMKWEAKVQIILLLILLVAFLDFLIGSFLPASKEKMSKGYVGFDSSVFSTNFYPDYRNGENFAHIFGVFFPAVTGILAGANISGNLKKPESAIPKGTLLSILITSTIYIVFAWICGSTVVREATGIIINDTIDTSCNIITCNYGLLRSYRVMEMVSVFGPIIVAGIFSASLSSALASLVSAPKVFQAVCEDKLFPKIKFFAKGSGKDNEPWRGYFLAFLISCLFIGLGDLNAIAPIISNFFLMSYALVNYSCFDASLSKTPGWRPSFKYYNKWVSLFGALLCISVMFLICWWAALISFLVIIAIHIYIKKAKPNVNWGSSSQAHIFRRSLEYSLKLMNIEEHVKNFRPNFLVLTGTPTNRSALCDFISSIAKSRSLMICANVIMDHYNNYDDVYSWFQKRKIKSFYSEIYSQSLRSGISSLIQTVGIGKMRPNTLVLGFKNNWLTDKPESVLEYYEIINDAFSVEFGICIMRLETGLDFTNLLGEEADEQNSTSESEYSDYSEVKSNNLIVKTKNIEILLSKQNNHLNLNQMNTTNLLDGSENTSLFSAKRSNIMNKSSRSINNMNLQIDNSHFKSTELIKLKNTKINQGALQSINIFYRKYQTGYVDVWWMYDDGGLSILLPHLLVRKKYWKKCKLRIFIQAKTRNSDVSEEQRNMATLLSKFRIEFHELIVFSTNDRKPLPSSVAMYEKLIESWLLKPNETIEQYPWKISESMLKQNIERINHYLRLRELLKEHSSESSLIFITISVPSRLSTCAGLYMSYLDLISYQMPPVLMVRGNQAPVLTYYS